MPNTISQAFVEQYKGNVIHLAEQQGSRLRGTTMEESVTGEKYHFERVGNVAAQLKTTRHSDTPVMDIPHSRRTGSMSDYEWADLVDKEDKVRMLISPESAYAKAGANAMGKAWDSLILTAALGNATDGDGASIALPAGQKIAAATTGMTIDKLLTAREIMDGNEADDERFLIVSAAQVTELLNSTEIKSADYNTVKALAAGQIDSFMGFKFIRSQLVAKAAGVRSCVAYDKSAIGLAIGADVTTEIDRRSDKSYAHQVYLSFTGGATRIEDERVVQIDCTEA